jgi:hypothetical protein
MEKALFKADFHECPVPGTPELYILPLSPGFVKI